ncbi:hypothetical protein M0804_011364 [Polistes exclamans]|nr:hypothetical protein M0804_011364 [Polistes exclamans]
MPRFSQITLAPQKKMKMKMKKLEKDKRSETRRYRLETEKTKKTLVRMRRVLARREISKVKRLRHPRDHHRLDELFVAAFQATNIPTTTTTNTTTTSTHIHPSLLEMRPMNLHTRQSSKERRKLGSTRGLLADECDNIGLATKSMRILNNSQIDLLLKKGHSRLKIKENSNWRQDTSFVQYKYDEEDEEEEEEGICAWSELFR